MEQFLLALTLLGDQFVQIWVDAPPRTLGERAQEVAIGGVLMVR